MTAAATILFHSLTPKKKNWRKINRKTIKKNCPRGGHERQQTKCTNEKVAVKPKQQMTVIYCVVL